MGRKIEKGEREMMKRTERRDVRQTSRGKRGKRDYIILKLATATQVHMPKPTWPLPSPSFH